MTDVQSPAAREDAGDGTEVVFVKHKLFTYKVPVLDSEGEPVMRAGKRGGPERPKVKTVHAQRFQSISLDDIPQEELDRGEELGAFFTEDEVAALRGQQDANAAEATEGTAEVPEGLNYDDHDSLVLWIKEQKPTAAAVVAAAENDSDKAEALLAAEVEATGGQPRKSVKEPLEKIIQGG